MKPIEPCRLRVDARAPRLLRIALDANDDEPTGSDLDALAAGLGIALVPAPVHVASTASSAIKSAALAIVKSKLISCVVLPGLVGAASASAVLKVAIPSQQERTLVSRGEAERIVAPAEKQDPPSSDPRTPVPAFVGSATSRPIGTASSTKVAPDVRERDVPAPIDVLAEPAVSVDLATAPESEVSLLERAKASVQIDPESALLLVAEHASRYPNGMLEQEAEVIAIESLVRARRVSSAIERLAQFRQRYQSSAYLPHLETVVRLGK